MSKALDNFIIGVKHLIQTAIDKAPFDKTYNGRVLSVNGDKYTVLINGKEYPNTTVQGGGDFAVDDMVKVIFPQNNANLRYIMSTGGGDATNAVLYTPQSLTDAQKSQARTNIGVSSGGGDLTGAVRYDAVQSLTDGQKTQARSNIGAYTKPLLGIPENDLNAEVRAKLNSTTDNIITITTEDTDPLYPYMSSKTLAEIKASFAEKSEQFVFYNNISYKLEKIITDNGVEKAVFYSTARLVNNALTYYTCEIYDGEFGYSAADFHTYTGGGDLTGAVRYDTSQSLTTEQKAQARTNIGAYAKPSSGIPKTDLSSDVQNKLDAAITSVNGKTGTSVVLDAEDIEVGRDYPYGGPTNVDDAINDIYQKLGSETHDVFWVSFTRNPISLDDWVSDEPVVFILEQYALGYMIKAKVYLELGSSNYVIVDYRGKVRIDNITKLVFSGIEGENVISILMYDTGEELPDEIEVSIEPYYQDLTPYRTAAEQNVIDNTKLTDAPADGKQYARKNGSWTEVVGNVQMVNGQTGVVFLDADDIPSTKTPTILNFVIDGAFDESNVSLMRNGVAVSANDFISAVESGFTVTVGIHDQSSGVVFSSQPVKYTVTNNALSLYFIATTGHTYSPELYVLRGAGSNYVSTLDEYDYRVASYQALYANANDLPYQPTMTVEQYLEALEARIAALENA